MKNSWTHPTRLRTDYWGWQKFPGHRGSPKSKDCKRSKCFQTMVRKFGNQFVPFARMNLCKECNTIFCQLQIDNNNRLEWTRKCKHWSQTLCQDVVQDHSCHQVERQQGEEAQFHVKVLDNVEHAHQWETSSGRMMQLSRNQRTWGLWNIQTFM